MNPLSYCCFSSSYLSDEEPLDELLTLCSQGTINQLKEFLKIHAKEYLVLSHEKHKDAFDQVFQRSRDFPEAFFLLLEYGLDPLAEGEDGLSAIDLLKTKGDAIHLSQIAYWIFKENIEPLKQDLDVKTKDLRKHAFLQLILDKAMENPIELLNLDPIEVIEYLIEINHVQTVISIIKCLQKIAQQDLLKEDKKRLYTLLISIYNECGYHYNGFGSFRLEDREMPFLNHLFFQCLEIKKGFDTLDVFYLKQIIENPFFDVNVKDVKSSKTALMYTSECFLYELSLSLLEKGADPFAERSEEMYTDTVMYWEKYPNIDFLVSIFDLFTRTDQQDLREKIFIRLRLIISQIYYTALLEENLPMIEKCFHIGQNPNENISLKSKWYRDFHGQGILHVAILKKNLELFTLALRNGADLQQENKKKQTPLQFALIQDLFFCDRILELFCGDDTIDRHQCIQFEKRLDIFKEVESFVLGKRADQIFDFFFSWVNKQDFFVLYTLMKKYEIHLFQLENLETEDDQKRNIFHLALENNDLGFFFYLMKKSKKVDDLNYYLTKQDNKGFSPLDIICDCFTGKEVDKLFNLEKSAFFSSLRKNLGHGLVLLQKFYNHLTRENGRFVLTSEKDQELFEQIVYKVYKKLSIEEKEELSEKYKLYAVSEKELSKKMFFTQVVQLLDYWIKKEKKKKSEPCKIPMPSGLSILAMR